MNFLFKAPDWRVKLDEDGAANFAYRWTMIEMAVTGSPVEITDEVLAEAARAGDRQAFSALISRYRSVAVAYARARLGNAEEAEDAAQEAFVRAYLSLDRFRSAACWGPWLMTILRNHCNDTLRKRTTRKTEALDVEWADSQPSPQTQMLIREGTEELNAAVMALPENYRIPVIMHYGMGRTYKEIALAIGTKESTVVGRMAGALRVLRRRLRLEDRP